MDKKLSFLSLAPHLKNLHVCGFFQLNPDSPKLHKLFQGIYMKLILFLILLFVVQQILKIYEVKFCVEGFNFNFLFLRLYELQFNKLLGAQQCRQSHGHNVSIIDEF